MWGCLGATLGAMGRPGVSGAFGFEHPQFRWVRFLPFACFHCADAFCKSAVGGYGLAALWGQTLPDLLAALAHPASWDCALSICMFSAFPAFDGPAVLRKVASSLILCQGSVGELCVKLRRDPLFLSCGLAITQSSVGYYIFKRRRPAEGRPAQFF